MRKMLLVITFPLLLGACADYEIVPTYAPPGAPQYKACNLQGTDCRLIYDGSDDSFSMSFFIQSGGRDHHHDHGGHHGRHH